MRRLGLVLLVLFIFSWNACALSEKYEESEDSELFWSKLTFQGLAIAKSTEQLEKFQDYDDWYYDQPFSNIEIDEQTVCSWSGITFFPSDEPPNFSSWVYTWNTLSAWPRYFNEMYFLGADKIKVDEKGYSPFWDGLRFCGEPVDPSTPPPNYDPEMDYWREVRDLVGYSWYWYYWVIDSIREYENNDAITWSWNGTEFDPLHSPPTYPSDHIEAARIDPWYLNHQVRGYLELWEEYFNDLYYESLAE